MPLRLIQASFIGTVLEGLFYGLYCIIFVLYIWVHTSKKSDDRNLLIYPISLLFVLCSAFFALDFTQQYLTVAKGQANSLLVWNLNISTSAIYAFIDVVAQGVLIYRCWVVWNKKLAVVVVPSILAIISLAASLTLVGGLVVFGPQIVANRPGWFNPIGILSFSVSLAVNSIFTGLLVFKIAKASLALRHTHARGFQDFTPLISMLIESGLVFLMAQLIWVICFSVESAAFNLVSGPITIIYGIIPTTIVVRVSMAGPANKAGNRSTNVESNLEFAYTDDSTKIISSRGESKETIV